MRKTRQRALRAAFKKEHGWAPTKTDWRNDLTGYRPSVWRRLKKAHLAASARSGTHFAERAITAATKEERRRKLKRVARQRRGAGRAA